MRDYHSQQLSQTTIAGVLGVSQPAVSKALQRTDPDDPEVTRVAALLGWVKFITSDAYKSERAHTRRHFL